MSGRYRNRPSTRPECDPETRRRRAARALHRPVRSWVLDGAVAAVVALAASLTDPPDGTGTGTAVAVVSLTVGVGLTLLRRVAPRTVTMAAILTWSLCGLVEPQLTLVLVVLVALYSVAAAGARIVAPASAVVVGGLVGTHLLFRPVDEPVLTYGLVIAVIAAVTGLGLYRGTRRDLVRQWRDRAQALEREQDRERELAATTERLRIARDMHDVVGHHLTVMVTLAEAAVTVLPDPDSPDGAGPAMTLIATTGRQALSETRRMLGALHSSAPPDSGEGKDPVESLAGPLRAAGLSVSSSGASVWEQLTPDLAVALQRIVQESFTNSLKYAGDRAVIRVRLDRFGSDVELLVTDDGGTEPRGSTPPVSSSGHGLHGMDERVRPWSGIVHAGPAEPRGWQVRVTLPGALAGSPAAVPHLGGCSEADDQHLPVASVK